MTRFVTWPDHFILLQPLHFSVLHRLFVSVRAVIPSFGRVDEKGENAGFDVC
jgi:hypothetical protein